MLSDEDFKRWEVTRQRKNRYLLTHGVLMWTLVSMVFYAIEVDFQIDQVTWAGAGLRLLVAALVGWLLGHLSYQRRERIYQRHRNKEL